MTHFPCGQRRLPSTEEKEPLFGFLVIVSALIYSDLSGLPDEQEREPLNLDFVVSSKCLQQFIRSN